MSRLHMLVVGVLIGVAVYFLCTTVFHAIFANPHGPLALVLAIFFFLSFLLYLIIVM